MSAEKPTQPEVLKQLKTSLLKFLETPLEISALNEIMVEALEDPTLIKDVSQASIIAAAKSLAKLELSALRCKKEAYLIRRNGKQGEKAKLTVMIGYMAYVKYAKKIGATVWPKVIAKKELDHYEILGDKLIPTRAVTLAEKSSTSSFLKDDIAGIVVQLDFGGKGRDRDLWYGLDQLLTRANKKDWGGFVTRATDFAEMASKTAIKHALKNLMSDIDGMAELMDEDFKSEELAVLQPSNPTATIVDCPLF